MELTRLVRTWALGHKLWSVVVAAAVLGGGWYAYATLTAPSTAPVYYTTAVATSTVVASLAETGQVSATSQVDLQSQSSGEVLAVPVAPGTHVAAGTAIAVLDPTNAQSALQSAEQNLQSSQIALAKLQEPATAVTLTQAQNAVASAQVSLTQAHTTGYNDVSAAFLQLPAVMTALDTTLHGTTVPGRTSQQNENAYADMVSPYDANVTQYEQIAESSYQTALASYNTALATFKSTPRDASDDQIQALVSQSYQAAANISDALKASTNFLNFADTTLSNRQLNIPTPLSSGITLLTNDTSQTNANVSALSNDSTTVTSSERSLLAAQASLAQVQTGADPLDIQSAQLAVQEKQAAVTTAQIALANTVVRAPFSGVVAKMDIQKYQTIGNGVTVATMVSDHQSANLSLNEVDAAKLAVGQKATITFDALPDLTIAGTVSSVDSLGTVSSGVVTYNAIVTFDTDNASVKPGMSASADIIVAQGTGLAVPASAVKTVAGASYVQIFTPPLPASSATTGYATTLLPTRVPVTIGLSDNSTTLITSGLTPGEQIVSQTSSASTAATKTVAAASTSVFGGTGGGRSGAVRIP